jgi:phosphate starvation-inducible PhoH-like protein
LSTRPKKQREEAQSSHLEFSDNAVLARVVGAHDRHLAEIERKLGVEITRRGNRFTIHGPTSGRTHAAQVLRDLYSQAGEYDVTTTDVDRAIRLGLNADSVVPSGASVSTPKRIIRPRTPVQARYLKALLDKDLVLGLGPAGTGKTYLAVAVGVSMLARGEADRLILSRPAVEAGERLGFLPGDLKEKVDPYLRPLYDALYDMLPPEQIQRRIDEGVIEVAPLAFMRGRTLAHSYVILDEAQNCTPQQMKMFLTRLGEGARMAVTGDPTQTDLPPGQVSGLAEARAVLAEVEGVEMVEFTDEDVVRHALVQRIVRAYAAHDMRRGNTSKRTS